MVWVNTLVASGIVFCFYSTGRFGLFFENAFSRLLGRLSFPLYLCHFSVLVSPHIVSDQLGRTNAGC